jgi:hypothetical protein
MSAVCCVWLPLWTYLFSAFITAQTIPMDFCIYPCLLHANSQYTRSIDSISFVWTQKNVSTQFSSGPPVTGFQSLFAIVSGLFRRQMFRNITFIWWWKLRHLPKRRVYLAHLRQWTMWIFIFLLRTEHCYTHLQVCTVNETVMEVTWCLRAAAV